MAPGGAKGDHGKPTAVTNVGSDGSSESGGGGHAHTHDHSHSHDHDHGGTSHNHSHSHGAGLRMVTNVEGVFVGED